MRISKVTERWFEVPEDADAAKIKIKHLSPEENADINDNCFKQKINYKKGRGKKTGFEPEITQESDTKLFRELPIQKAVIDWTNFYDKDSKPLECTPENVLRASREIEGFNDLIAEFREELAKDIAEEKKEQLKNL